MREILFKGKRKDYGEWVEGSLIIDENGNYYIGKCVAPKTSTLSTGRNNGKTLNRFVGYGMFMVIPETVGQYTGLKDKNGKMIFEGDIMKWNDKEWGAKYREVVEWDYNLLSIRKNDWSQWCEIIGNIHDNPELLKEEV